MRALECTKLQMYRIQEETYTLQVFEGKTALIFQLMKKDAQGKVTIHNSTEPLKNILRSIISDYEIPSIADRTYVMEGSMFCIRLTDNDVIVDTKFSWSDDVMCARFYTEDRALLWVLNHFRVERR